MLLEPGSEDSELPNEPMAMVQGHQVFGSSGGRNERREMGRFSGSISSGIWVFVLFGQWIDGVAKLDLSGLKNFC